MSSEKRGLVEEFEVAADDLAKEVEKLLHEGNVRRIVVKKEGHTVMEIPLTLAAIGVIAAPLVAALGALAALVGKYTVVVERKE